MRSGSAPVEVATRRVCATAGCDTVLSRYAPRGTQVCGACEKRLAEEHLAREHPQAHGGAVPEAVPAARPETRQRTELPTHEHFGPTTSSNRAGGRIGWRPADPRTAGAVMVTETCSCQATRYELMRFAGRRLIRRTTADRKVNETEPMPVRDADRLWESLLAGRCR